ncbi:MAG: SDR family oxidoreductase [Mycobacteriaceae bacterium]|nr:SDR family oxidoreductase [Mycobacteriaceae bacterium]
MVSSNYVSDLFTLNGLVAVVTGGSSGIGRAAAEALGRAGARVVLIARNRRRLEIAADSLVDHGCSAAFICADLSERGAVRQAADAAAEPFGEPDILINCAAVNLRPHLSQLTERDWDTTLATNLTAPFLFGQRYGPVMARQGWGRIINVASQQTIRAFDNSGAYGVSKAAVSALTRSQAEAWSAHGVRVNAIAPGLVKTPLSAALFDNTDRTEAMARRTMVGRNGDVDDFAGLAVFLAGRACDYLTGQTIFLDGGFSVS